MLSKSTGQRLVACCLVSDRRCMVFKKYFRLAGKSSEFSHAYSLIKLIKTKDVEIAYPHIQIVTKGKIKAV
ncbi:hypothetical protein JXA85_00040 [Candidatus Woesearchaeota archaeon]|nr:hypothetical protein [Candidatus Woesearchaeota archaeon]